MSEKFVSTRLSPVSSENDSRRPFLGLSMCCPEGETKEERFFRRELRRDFEEEGVGVVVEGGFDEEASWRPMLEGREEPPEDSVGELSLRGCMGGGPAREEEEEEEEEELVEAVGGGLNGGGLEGEKS